MNWKALLYLFVVLLAMNPFVFFVVGGQVFSHFYGYAFSDEFSLVFVWLLASIGYYIVWVKARMLFPSLDEQAVNMYTGKSK